MDIQVFRRLLARNEATAQDIRRRLDEYGIVLFNIMGSPGSGKTAFLEQAIPFLAPQYRCAVLVGDLATTQDAERLARFHVPVAQLLTEGGCHLEARLVHEALSTLPLERLDCVFVENVGNLVCPANFDLGEHLRLVILSVAEGEDKPSKYPYMFQRAAAVVINKCDLLPYCRFNLSRVREDLCRINPNAEIFDVSCTEGSGVSESVCWIVAAIQARQIRVPRPEEQFACPR